MRIENKRIERKLFDLINILLNKTQANDVNEYFEHSIRSEIKR